MTACSKLCKARNHTCGRCGKKGHLDSLCRSARTPLHMLKAQDYTSPQPIQSQETLQDYNQSLGTAQCSTPYSVSKEELPQATCNSLNTVQVWIAQSQDFKKHQVDVEIDTEVGCNVIPLYKVKELFGQE